MTTTKAVLAITTVLAAAVFVVAEVAIAAVTK